MPEYGGFFCKSGARVGGRDAGVACSGTHALGASNTRGVTGCRIILARANITQNSLQPTLIQQHITSIPHPCSKRFNAGNCGPAVERGALEDLNEYERQYLWLGRTIEAAVPGSGLGKHKCS